MSTKWEKNSVSVRFLTICSFNSLPQLRIRVECAFGMLVQRWSILRTPISSGMSIKKVIALVNCLAKLHNFCIGGRTDLEDDNGGNGGAGDNDDDDDNNNNDLTDDPLERFGNLTETAWGYTILEASTEHPEASLRPVQLLDGGNHFRGLPRQFRRDGNDESLPRQRLHDQVVDSHLIRPPTIRRRIGGG